MATATTVHRRLVRTKEAATYLSMSEWKLRRLIQDGIVPFIQDQEGGPFLLDIRDLDVYIEGNKHIGVDELNGQRKNSAPSSRNESGTHPRRSG